MSIYRRTEPTSDPETHAIDAGIDIPRSQLANLYRAFAATGFAQDGIFNHISLRVPDTDRYLVNEYGYAFSEITEDRLVEVDLRGVPVEPPTAIVNRAGLRIHTAIHCARSDLACIIHTHSTASAAVSCLQEGLLEEHLYSASITGGVSYHDFEGTTTDWDECERIVSDLGASTTMFLRNHGVVVGGTDVYDAFNRYFMVERACQIQVAALSTGLPRTALSDSARARSLEATRTRSSELPPEALLNSFLRITRGTGQQAGSSCLT